MESISGLAATVVMRCRHTIETVFTEHTPVIVSVHHLSHVPCIVALEGESEGEGGKGGMREREREEVTMSCGHSVRTQRRACIHISMSEW